MANTTGGECVIPSTIQFWVSVGITGMFIVALLAIQSFIVAVNVIDWMKGRSVTAVDQIITSIGVTRIIYHMSCPMHYLSYNCSAGLGTTFFLFNLFTGLAAGFSGIWISSLLSTFFCFKISTFSKAIFLRLKTIISQRVVYLLISSVLLGFGYSFTLVLFISFAMYKDVSYSDIIHNDDHFQDIFSIHCFWNIFPILMFFASSVLLVISLAFHIRQMKNHGNIMISTDTYHKMMMFTAVSFLICVLCIIANLAERYGTRFFGIVWMYVFWNIFPVLHSASLIYVTTKLRNEFFRIFQCGMDCMSMRRVTKPDTREQMEVTHS